MAKRASKPARPRQSAAARPAAAAPRREILRDRLFPLLAGVWLGLALLKFGNPVILDRMIAPPGPVAELIFLPWPFAWGAVLSFFLLLAGIAARGDLSLPARWRWLFWLPAAWFGWQIFAGARTVAPHLTNVTLVHFAITAAAFYLGYFVLGTTRGMKWFWVPLILAFAWVLLRGFEQHYGGLEASRQVFYAQEDWREYPAEYLKRIATDRIFSTLVYPNALAGAILLLGPILVYQFWRLSARWPRVLRGAACGLFAYLALGCLYWTGSKGGWLIALAMAGVLLLQLPGRRRLKIAAVSAVVVIGLAAFFIRYGAYFERGAPSVGARFGYWSAAWQTALDNPILGTGPGTFAVPYAKIKPPEAEMARLVHNDYLEQASDSGWVGFLLYTTFVLGSVFILYRYSISADWNFRLISLGLLAWTLQGLIEFGLYIPALAWPVFLLFGVNWKEVEGKIVNDNACKSLSE